MGMERKVIFDRIKQLKFGCFHKGDKIFAKLFTDQQTPYFSVLTQRVRKIGSAVGERGEGGGQGGEGLVGKGGIQCITQ